MAVLGFFKMNKRGDIQINETIIVLIVFSIILFITIGIFYRYNIQSAKDLEIEFRENRILNLLSTLPNSPELVYTKLGNEDNSVDTSKLINLKLDKSGFMEIRINEVYPGNNNGLCDNSNYPNCNEFLIYSNKGNKKNYNILATPVSLYYPLLKEYRAGTMEIKWYS